jgi:WD40 repeat protein
MISTVDGRELLSWVQEATPAVCRQDPPAGEPACDLGGVTREGKGIALSPDGRLLVVAVGGVRPRVEVYDTTGTPRVLWQALFPASSGGASHVAFSSDGRWVVALAGAGELHRFDALTGGLHMSIPSAGRSAVAVPPGREIAVAGEMGELTVWRLSDGTIQWRLPPRKLRGPVDLIASSGDGKRVATLEYDQDTTVVRVWDLNSSTVARQVMVDAYAVVGIALDRKGDRLFVAHEDKGLMAADLSTREVVLTPLGGATGRLCKGYIGWVDSDLSLTCALEDGVQKIHQDGSRGEMLGAGSRSSSWLVAVSDGTGAVAALGGGRLVIWRSTQGEN